MDRGPPVAHPCYILWPVVECENTRARDSTGFSHDQRRGIIGTPIKPRYAHYYGSRTIDRNRKLSL